MIVPSKPVSLATGQAMPLQAPSFLPTRNLLIRIGLVAFMVIALISCTDMPASSAQGGFKKQYFAARTQLEKGQVQKALTSYRQLAQERGPFESRILLELSHAYLRVADFDAARRSAHSLTEAKDTRLRAAALAVIGTAEHELANRRIASGDTGKATRTHLKSARAALSKMLKLHADLDATGAMATRLAQIKAAQSAL